MYVEIDSKSLISTPPTRKTTNVEVKRFNALKTMWGLPQVLRHGKFNNLKNGYVYEGGQCEFGVDVIVAPPLTNWEILSFSEKLPQPKFSCAVKKFSELEDEVYKSDTFSMGGRKWVLYLYAKGDSRADGKWLSVFLYLADSDKPKAYEKIFTQAHVRVLDPLGSNHVAWLVNVWHKESNTGWGWSKFLSLTELRKLYLDKEDTLNVEIEFQVVSANKYSPII